MKNSKKCLVECEILDDTWIKIEKPLRAYSLEQFAESTYPTENAQIKHFTKHRERKVSPIP